MNQNRKHFILIVGLLMLASISRLFPHLWNFTPIAAIALFAGVYLKNRLLAFGLPLLCLFFSDLLLHAEYMLGYAEYPALYLGRWTVYSCFLMIVAVGRFIQKNKVSLPKIVLGSFAGSVLFFILSNFFAWLTDHQYYPVKNMETLLYSYQLGLPFFRGTLLGDLFYNGVLFGSFEWFRRSAWYQKGALQEA